MNIAPITTAAGNSRLGIIPSLPTPPLIGQRAAKDDQPADEHHHAAADTEHVAQSPASQQRQPGNEHYRSDAGSEHPSPYIHGSTSLSFAVLAFPGSLAMELNVRLDRAMQWKEYG